MGVGASTGTVTFLFTDIEGSTRLWQQDEVAMRAALERHDAVLHTAIEEHRGVVFSTMGDGMAAAFQVASSAVAAALAAQDVLAKEPWPTASPIRVRMGLHTGQAELRDGDYFGTAVNLTARLMAIGHGGQVLCSQATAALVEGDFHLVDLGEHRLRDLSATVRVFQVGGGTFAPLRSLDAVPGNLPMVLTELVGRTDDIARLVKVVENERLVTLTGVGGIGKTRLALAVAAAVAPSFADGCWFAELAPAGSEDEVVQAVASAMGAPVTDRASLARYVSDRQVLVVLDNCEHVLSHAARLAQSLLAAGPDVVIVATSREPLGLDGEVVRGVASLSTPEEDDVEPSEALEASAVRLFVARASDASEQFTLDESTVSAVVAICRRLDGIPLAIELAAARVRSMDPAEIAARLGERFRLLGAGRGAQERHRTLQAVFSWSYDLLSDDEQMVFRRLAVFPGSFTLDAAERVARGDETVDGIDVVVHLADRSLLQYDGTTHRYRLLETLRQYAADRLAEADETLAAREAHAFYFCDLVERYASHLLDARFGEAVAQLLPELENLRSAATWLTESGRYEALLGLGHQAYWLLVQYAPADGERWLQQAIDGRGTSEDQEQVDALGELSHLIYQLGDWGAGLDVADRSIRLAEDRGIPASPWAWAGKAVGGTLTNDPRGSLVAAEAGLAVASVRHDLIAASVMESTTVYSLAALGDLEAARAAAEESLLTALATGNSMAIATAIVCLVSSRLFVESPDYAGALDILDRRVDLDLPAEDSTIGLWLALIRGVALIGLKDGSEFRLLVRCLRSADRLQNLPATELAVHLVVLGAAAAGKIEPAALLLGYLNTNLVAYRTNPRLVAWIDERIEVALGALSTEERNVLIAQGARYTRRELMALVTSLEGPLETAASPTVG